MSDRGDEATVYLSILGAGAGAGYLAYLAVGPVTTALDAVIVIASPVLVIGVLTWGYRAWMRSIDAMRAEGIAEHDAIEAFVSTLTVEQAETLARASIGADRVITRPAQRGITPDLPYGFPPDVRALFKDYGSVFDSTGMLSIMLDLEAPEAWSSDQVASLQGRVIGQDHDELLIVRERAHDLVCAGPGEAPRPVESIWHWLLERTISLGDLRHDLRDTLRTLGIEPPDDPNAPLDPAPLTSADRRERRQPR